MKSFKETIYFHREKEDNWDIVDKAEELGFKGDLSALRYIGYDVDIEIEVSENLQAKIISICGVNVSDRDIYI